MTDAVSGKPLAGATVRGFNARSPGEMYMTDRRGVAHINLLGVAVPLDVGRSFSVFMPGYEPEFVDVSRVTTRHLVIALKHTPQRDGARE